MNERRELQGRVALIAAEMSDHQADELAAFATYCATRLERQVAVGDQTWTVTLERHGHEVDAVVEVHGIAARGSSADHALAIWEAMCRIEQPLRDRIRTRPSHRGMLAFI